MTSPIFIDTNVPVYAGGREHPFKEPCRRVLTLVEEQPSTFFTSAEVLQELLHRYLALRIWNQGRIVFENFSILMSGRVEPLYAADVEAAQPYVNLQHGLNARDLVHYATMNRIGADRIVSADRAFDRLPGITRLDPAAVDAWSARLA